MDIFYSEKHRLHATQDLIVRGESIEYEETPQRAEIIRQALTRAGLGTVRAPHDFGLQPILAVHDAGYIDFLQNTYRENETYYGQPGPAFAETFAVRHPRRQSKHPVGRMGYYAFGSGTPILAGTWEAAYSSAQCALSAAEAVQRGQKAAYALCRPPGHHAAASLYGGFCFINNAAAAARWLPGKTAILDIDYHHGNGTQEIFYTDPSVLYCSLHAHPDDDYPYFWGAADETGEGAGLGYNRNWPLPQGTEDTTYLNALGEALGIIHEYGPAYLVLSAGLDLAAGDPVGGFVITQEGIREIGRRIAGLGLPTVIVQEGGYLLEKLGENAVALLDAWR